MKCPCCSGLLYEQCCKPLHEGTPPETALALMRSRYSAYAQALPAYIQKTTHPKSPHFEQTLDLWTEEILTFCRSTEFIRLEIVSYKENFVHFKAHLKQNNKTFILEEKSHFEKVGSDWLYLKGELIPQPE